MLTKFVSTIAKASTAPRLTTRCFSAYTCGPAKLPDMPYDYGELEPYISGEIMKIHHTKHHQAYVTNLNTALEKQADAEAKGDLSTIISLQPAIKFNGGGHINHTIFWSNLASLKKGGGGTPTGELATYINKEFSSFEGFQSKLTSSATSVQGSGWAWLGYCKERDTVKVVTTANQDPCVTTGLIPLLGIDVWEHAYYLQYKNVRPDYLKAIWNVINFNNVAERLAKAKAK